MKRIVGSMLAAILAVSAAGPAIAGTAIFAGGCFWCVESDFEAVAGVTEAVSGYTGGTSENPTYQSHADHVEAVRITFDETKVSYEQLLHTFWRTIDPTDSGGQFCDRGHSYTTAIFTLDAAQKEAAERTKAEIDASGRLGKPIVTEIRDAGTFTVAEDYHQDFYKTNPARYQYYRRGCGRDARVDALWGDEARAGVGKH